MESPSPPTMDDCEPALQDTLGGGGDEKVDFISQASKYLLISGMSRRVKSMPQEIMQQAHAIE